MQKENFGFYSAVVLTKIFPLMFHLVGTVDLILKKLSEILDG